MHVEKVNAPILIWTGHKNETVHWGHTIEFYIGLKRKKKGSCITIQRKGA